MRKVTKILVWTVCGAVAMVCLAAASLWLPPVQRAVAQRAAAWLGTKLDATVGFSRVHVRPIAAVSFDGLYAIDNQGDTLLYADLEARVGWNRQMTVRRVAASNGQADIKLITSKLSGDGGSRLAIAAAEMSGMRLRYDTVVLDNVALKVRNFRAEGKDISLKIKKLRFDYRGEEVSLSAPVVAAAAGKLTMDGAHIAAAANDLRFERLRFDFATKKVDATLRNSTVALPKLTIKHLNASVLGTIDDVTAEVYCAVGEATRFRGSGRWQRAAKTFTLRADTLETTAADIAEIAPLFTQKPLPNSLTRILRRLQSFSLTGDFDSNKGSFTTRATLATALGSASANISLSADNVTKGEVTLQDFDLGSLLAVKEFGRATATATIDGLAADINIDHIAYKGYDYQYITADTQFENRHLKAHIQSHDPNLIFKLDLTSALGRTGHDFDLHLSHADLHALHINARDKVSQVSLTARGTVGENSSVTINNILYINHLDTIRTNNIVLAATPEYQKITSDLTLLSALVPDLDASENSSFTATRQGDITTFSARAGHLRRGSADIGNLAIDGHAHTDTLTLAGNFDLGSQRWCISADEIIPQSKQLSISNLTLESGGQRLIVNGTASHSTQDTLAIAAENFDLTPISEILRVGHRIGGRASGRALLTATLARPALTAAINLDSLQIDHMAIPDLDFRSSWQDGRVQLLLLQHGLATPILAAGYSPATHSIDGNINIRNVDLSLLDTHYKRALSGTRGRADVTATISGTPGRGGVKINGDIAVHDYSATIDFLGVRYAAAPETHLKIGDNIIRADRITVLDPENHPATLTAAIDLRRLKNIAYKFDVASPNLLILDTSQRDSRQFYGHVYTALTASFDGGKQGSNLAVTATTQPGSSFFMPLNDKHDVAERDYLTFSTGASNATPVRRRSRMSSNINLTVEPNTTVELLIDPQTGHRLQGQGNGLLNLEISPRDGEFTIYGDYRINEGTYLFTLENIIEKPFAITPGSSIQWAGNPRDALLDIAATYDLKTSIGPAMAGTGYDAWRMRIPVECRIHLTEHLSAPSLAFEITAPNATPETQSILHSFLDTPEMTATQFFFLVATGNFYDYESGAEGIGAAAGTTTAFDFLSSQLTGLIPTRNTNIGIRYRPQTETTSDEWGVGFTQQLWGERLLLEVEGNYDTRNNQSAVYTENMRNFTGDFYLTGLINRRGTLRAKAFTRTITRFDENQGLQENGAGIYFTEEFNTFTDLFNFLKHKKTNK
jgi:hypothetical protein